MRSSIACVPDLKKQNKNNHCNSSSSEFLKLWLASMRSLGQSRGKKRGKTEEGNGNSFLLYCFHLGQSRIRTVH